MYLFIFSFNIYTPAMYVDENINCRFLKMKICSNNTASNCKGLMVRLASRIFNNCITEYTYKYKLDIRFYILFRKISQLISGPRFRDRIIHLISLSKVDWRISITQLSKFMCFMIQLTVTIGIEEL